MLRRHGLAVAVLVAAVVVFFVPQLTAGTIQWDAVDVHYASQRYFADAIHNGHLPFWTPYIFSGFPFLADLQTGAWYPLHWPFLLRGITEQSISEELLLHMAIASLGAYALAYRFLDNTAAAIGAGVFYGLSGYFAAHSQHLGMVETAAWLPWLVLLVERVASDGFTPRRLALAGLLGAAVALPGHFQTALYAFSGVTLYALLHAALTRTAKRAVRSAAALAVAGLWGGAIAAIMIVPGIELTRQSVRTQLNASDVDLGYFHLDSLVTLLQPDYYGVLLDSRYTGPGDVTQHYFYAGVLLVPFALAGLLNGSLTTKALALGMPFIWYALGPVGGLFTLVAQLPGFRSVELPMHGWFLPALGLALLGGAGLARIKQRWLIGAVVAVVFVDIFIFNGVQNRLTFARETAEDLYEMPLRDFQKQIDPTVQRVYGAELASVVYRNHALQSRVETTYGYNPLELGYYADYQAAAESNPRLIDGMAVTHYLDNGALKPYPSGLPLAYFARSLVNDVPLEDLDPARETLVDAAQPALQPDASATVTAQDRGTDSLTLRYRTAGPSLLRVAIPYFPGWHAAANGTELPIQRVDHAYLGTVVPPGEGEIRLWYAPRFFWPAAAAAVLALAANLAVLARAWLPLPIRLRLPILHGAARKLGNIGP